jgi:dihydrolipoamide dehydrogenase
MEDIFDLVVVGGGVAGITVAIRAAQMGLRVAIVEKDKIGGVHVNWGGIPTKALVSAVEILRKVIDGGRLGVNGTVSIDWNALQKHRVKVSSQIVMFNEMALKKSGVKIFRGGAELISTTRVRISSTRGEEEKVVKAKNMVIATGSRSMSIPGVDPGGNILDSDGALQLEKPPESLLIIGGGAVGLEFGTIFSLLGSKVTVVELLQRLLPNEEPEVGEFVKNRLQKEGVQVLTGSKVAELKPTKSGVIVKIDSPDGQKIEEVEKVLMAIGRQPNIDSKRLEALGVKMTKRGIVVNERMQTTVPNIYAVGDVVGKHLLLNVAMKEAKVAASSVTGGNEAMEYKAVPRCVFTIPEVAAVGLTEQQAREKGLDIIVVKEPFFSPRAAGAGEVEGLIKIVAKPDSTIIGATIVGSHASEIIFPLSLAVHKGINALELAEMFYPSPTFSEAIMNVLGKIEGKAIFGFG